MKTSRYLNFAYISLLAQFQSHSVGRGAEFTNSAFNTYGRSPLVAQFLRMQRLSAESGVNVRVGRTEVTSLPPLNSQTYIELLHDSFRQLKTKRVEFQQ